MKAPVLLLALLFWTSSFAGEAKTVRLLTIGNSFSANATRHLGDLAKAGGHTLIHTPLVIGGSSFQVHADKTAAEGKARLYSNGRDLVGNLAADQWDYVTIQQASIKSHDFATYQPYAGILRDLITKHAPQAKLLVHETWEYRVDDPRFAVKEPKPGEPKTQDEMYEGLRASYDKIAMAFDARIIPTGDAFHLADKDETWGYHKDAKPFDPKTAKQPELPDQTHSLHVGWRWAKSKDGTKITLGMDGHHANMAGEYLGGCVWYEVLFGESAVGNTYVPKGLEANYARFLQETAHKAVQARLGVKKDAAAVIQAMPDLVAFWNFQEETGQARVSGDLKLQEMKGPVNRVDGGVFGPHSAQIKRGQWFMLAREDIGALDIHGKDAEVTLAAWIYREDKAAWQAIAGVWDETRGKRQYCLFLNAPRGTRADEMKRYPLANRIHGHVSAVGGPTPGEDFCITYSSGASEIPMNSWQCLVMRYAAKESRVCVDGKLDVLEHYNPFSYPEGLFDGGAEGAPFTVGAVHRGGTWGNFFGGRIGGLAVFKRALSDEEIVKLASVVK